jgi:hypothetical protein
MTREFAANRFIGRVFSKTPSPCRPCQMGRSRLNRHPTNADRTLLSGCWRGGKGDVAARDRLISLVYDELYRIARRPMRHERPDHTLQASALVNETCLRLVGQRGSHWRHPRQFLPLRRTSRSRFPARAHSLRAAREPSRRVIPFTLPPKWLLSQNSRRQAKCRGF